jgi:hypothetical protein
LETDTTEERNIIREFTPEHERREILDWFHLMENLHKVGGSIQRINKAKSLLWQGKVDDAIACFADCTLKQSENYGKLRTFLKSLLTVVPTLFVNFNTYVN